jgi:tetratricopeptide (TPR) repeat protein
MLDSGAFKNILEGIDFLGLIGCRDLRRFFADNYGISNSWFINVPEQGGVAYSAYVPVHFPHYAEAILAGIKVPHPGAVFLVGAGVCGKLYCDVIKQRGGIAIDVGSLFDLWAGRFTRPYMNLGAIISYYQNRLDAGETGPEVFHAVADYHRARNDLANETALIDRAIECNPALFDFYYRKIDILLRQGLQTEAELFAHRAATQNFASGGPEAFRMAKLFLNTGNRDAGSAFLTIAINKTPTYAPALVELANFYMGPEEEFPPGALFDVPALIKTACADTADYQLLSQYARLVGAKGPFEDAIAIANRSTQLFSYDHYIYEQKSAWENALGLQEQASQSIATAASLQAAHV